MNQAKIYVGNLSYQATAEDLTSFFQTYGNVIDAKIITDRDSGRSKGFGFVTFETPEAANAAVEGSDGTEVKGRALKVSIAREQERTGGGGGGAGGRGGDSRGGRGGAGGGAGGRTGTGRGSW